MEPIHTIAKNLGLVEADIIPYGTDKAKIRLEVLDKFAPRGKLILVSAITPTAAGEGKTLWIVPDGRHGQNHQLDPDKYEERIIDFFNHAFEQ